MKSIKVLSPAKLNLFLEVINKRPDGYHTIATLFERISLADEIVLKEIDDDAVRVETGAKDIPSDSTNLAYRAAALIKNDLGVAKGVVIKLKKRIPVGAGLGGGSSNAAAVLLGLNTLWGLRLSRRKLFMYASAIGSDVAFFVAEASFALGSARGEKITPLPRLKRKLWHVLAVPAVNVSTKEVYQALDTRSYREPRRVLMASELKNNFSLRGLLFNRLEEVTYRRYPAVKQLNVALKRQGLENVLMSGSGGSVFGIVNSRKEGLRAARQLQYQYGKGVKVYVVHTI